MDATDRRRRASAEASRWFALLQSDQMRRDEREQYIDWLRESPLHVGEMLRVAHIHGALEQFNLWTEITTGPKTPADDDSVIHLEPHPSAPPPPERPARYRVRLFAALAGALVLVAAFLFLSLTRGQVIDTDRGERREVVLADGSVLQVDPETRLRVKYSDALRQVLLERGRAVFHVAKNPHRPFQVRSDGTTVRAVGTAFGVERQIHNIVVTVAEGKVAVIPTVLATASGSGQITPPVTAEPSGSPSGVSGSAADNSPPSPARRSGTHLTSSASPNRELLLTANQQVIVQASGSADPVREVDSHQALAWAEGRLIFHNDTVETAIGQFNRYNRVQITVTDPALAAHPVNGVFNASQPESFIAFLQSAAQIQVIRDGDKSITLQVPDTRSQ